MLSIPVASGSTERHFSETGALITKKEAQLDALNAERIMFIHDNFKHIEKLEWSDFTEDVFLFSFN